MEFGNIWGFYGFAAVLFLILLYLIKPRPKDMILPSLMFLVEDKGKVKKKTFFKRFINSVMFLLQLLALSMLAFGLTNPSFMMNYDSTAGYTVVVLDVSASMKTFDGTKTRFDNAVKIAKRSLKGKTSIILAADKPMLLLEHKSEKKAESMLSTIKPKDTTTNLGDAMVMAGNLLPEGEGRVIVISDFINTEGADPMVARATLENKGLVVDFVEVGEKKENLAIIDMKIGMFDTKAIIKNYADQEKTVTIQAKFENNGTGETTKTILADSVETFTFDSAGGATKVTILDNDELPADNFAYVSNPKKRKVDALLITNNENIFLKNAMEAAGNINISISEPPVVPSVDYEIIILGNYSNEKMLPGTMEDIEERVTNGASLIITPQEDMESIDFKGMLPVIIGPEAENSDIIKVADNFFTKDVEFGSAPTYYKASLLNESVAVAEAAADDSPIIALKEYMDGSAVYYGIYDSESEFKSSPGYPIFWNGLASFLMGIEDTNNFNLQTGKIMGFTNPKIIITPKGKVKTTKIVMDTIGLYAVDKNIYAANLLDEAESDINQEPETESIESDEYAAREVNREKEVSLELYLVIIAAIIITIELLYLKFRGDA